MRTLAALLVVALAACGTSKPMTKAPDAPPLAVKVAPDFTLTDSDGNSITLSKELALGPVILAFYPKAFTGGCTRELTAYKDQYAKALAKGARVIAISVDDVETLKKFKESLGAPYTFLSDPGGTVAAQYGGVSEGYAKRATFVVAQDGTIGHTDEGMNALVPDPALEACPSKNTPKTL